MQIPELYRSIRQMLELDHELGIRFVARSPEEKTEKKAETTRQPNHALKASNNTKPESAAPPALPPLKGTTAPEKLAEITEFIQHCQRCPLACTRSKTVPGTGNAEAQLLFIGEAPGFDEDQQGQPFVGKAGQLLNKMIGAMGLSRDEVFIANIIKCRPPQNRRPEDSEVQACWPYIEEQILAIKPQIICTLGNTPLKALKPGAFGITRERGRRFLWKNIPVIPTFHPSYLLRNAEAKKPCWQDLQMVMAELGLKP